MYLDDMAQLDRYTHGHHESVLRSHTWRTARNSAGFLLPHLKKGDRLLDVGCGPGTITMDLAELVARVTSFGIDRSHRSDRTGPASGEARALSNLSFAVGDVSISKSRTHHSTSSTPTRSSNTERSDARSDGDCGAYFEMEDGSRCATGITASSPGRHRAMD